MEVPRQRSRRSLRPRGTVIQHQMTTDRERCAHCWKCLHKLSSGCHRPLLHKRPAAPVIINHAGEDQEPERSRQIARPRSHEIAKFSSLLAVIVPTYGCGQSKEVQTGHTAHLSYDGPTSERPSNGSALAKLGSVTQ